MKAMRTTRWALPCVAGFALAACGPVEDPDFTTGQVRPAPDVSEAATSGPGIGMDVGADGGAYDVRQVALMSGVPYRAGDPFALLPSERQFENEQLAERFLQEQGGWFQLFAEEPPPVQATQTFAAPVPSWRLGGVVIGETAFGLVYADGGLVADIRAGERVILRGPGGANLPTEWTTKSISKDQATFEREQGLPREFTLNIEPGVVGGAAAAGAGFGGPAAGAGRGGPTGATGAGG